MHGLAEGFRTSGDFQSWMLIPESTAALIPAFRAYEGFRDVGVLGRVEFSGFG